MERLGGFDSARLVVGVSGGGDSMALVLLADRWVRARGGSLLALTVDHGLRPESAAEAACVGDWLAARGIEHRILRWDGEKPHSGLQAAARAARYALLRQACAEAGIDQLALAHHRDDQAETVLLRLSRGSGVDGLAAMAAARKDGPLRLIRPLLAYPHERLLATCRAFGQEWIEDPANRNPAYARGRLRAVAALLAGEGLDAAALAATARRAGRARAALESMTNTLLAEAADLRPEGWIRLRRGPLLAVPEEIGLRALARCLATIGGADRPPKAEALERLFAETAGDAASGRTLAGCRIVPVRSVRRDELVIAREPELADERTIALPGQCVLWDRRFAVRLSSGRKAALTVARLGPSGWRTAVSEMAGLRRLALPEPVRDSLPALWDGDRLVSVPSLGFGGGFAGDGQARSDEVSFRPATPLVAPAFTVVSEPPCII